MKKGVLRNFAKFTGKLGIDIKIVIWLFFLICPLNMPQNGTYECLQNFFLLFCFQLKTHFLILSMVLSIIFTH